MVVVRQTRAGDTSNDGRRQEEADQRVRPRSDGAVNPVARSFRCACSLVDPDPFAQSRPPS